MSAIRSFSLGVWALSITLSGCAIVGMAPDAVVTPSADQAVVVFMEGNWGAYGFVYEGDAFLGIASPRGRFEVAVPPGEHTFEVVNENLDFMTAQLEAGKTYHANVRPAPGFGSHPRVYFSARNEQGDTKEAYASTVPMKPTERGLKYVEKYRVRKNKLHDRTWAKWTQQPEEKRANLRVPTEH